jgi:malate dehydrogenase (oxaloacetate-decarboxylating)(NADP+)
LSAVQFLKPSALIGVSAIPNTFTREICEEMAQYNQQPIIFALSNPTSKAECTARQAYEWTEGKAIFCSGSPFAEVELPDGRRFVPGQGNNAYIFPGVGLGVVAAGSRRITDHDMLLAAETLASLVTDEQLQRGCMYPPLSEIRQVSKKIAVKIALRAHEMGLAVKDMPEDMEAHIQSIMYDPFAEAF